MLRVVSELLYENEYLKLHIFKYSLQKVLLFNNTTTKMKL